jgi:hypothetical protein
MMWQQIWQAIAKSAPVSLLDAHIEARHEKLS